jgi:hypothetical protein
LVAIPSAICFFLLDLSCEWQPKSPLAGARCSVNYKNCFT